MFKHSKLKKTLSLFLVLTLFLAVLPSTSLADDTINSDDTVTPISIYDPTLVFPDYAEATTYQERLAATQLPESFFDRIPTEDLVYIILCTPSISEVLVANDLRFGDALDRAAERYNVIAELETRDDSATALLEKYASLDFEAIANDNGAFSYLSYFSPVILELFLGRDVYFDRLTTEQKEELFTLAAVTAEKKVAYDVCGGGFANIFYENLDANAAAYYAESVGLAEPMNTGSETTTVFTYGGLSVNATKWVSGDVEISNEEASNISGQNLSLFGLSYDSAPTYKYNCHSYAWCYQSTSNTLWIDDSEASKYVQCSSSTEVSNPQSGNIVVYFSASGTPLHSGVVTSVSGSSVTVTSKWGPAGLYTHGLYVVPGTYTPTGGYIKYYSYTVHKYDGWEPCNGNEHQKICSLCRMVTMNEIQPHTWDITQILGGSHRRYCTDCGYSVLVKHVAASYTATTHTVDCDECGYYDTWEHGIKYNNLTETGHTEYCEFCGYTAAKQHHFSGWQSVDASCHEKTCIDCDYAVSEAHTPNAEETRCTTCGALGPFVSIMSRKPENCEIVLK